MTTFFIVCSAMFAGFFAFVAAAWKHNRIIRQRMRSVVIVTTRDGHDFKGVLYEADAHAIVLRNAAAVGADGGRDLAVDGEILLLREQIVYMQRP